MGCTESRNILFAVGRKNGKKLNLRWRIRKPDKQDSRTSSRIQNISAKLSKFPVNAKATNCSTRPKSRQELDMIKVLQQNMLENLTLTKACVVDGISEDDEDTYLEVIEEKIKIWKIESCLRVNNSRPQAAKGPRKPVSENRNDDITADVRKLEQDMQAVIDGADDNRIRIKAGQDFCISQVSNEKSVLPDAAHGIRTPCTLVSAEEYVLPGAILDLSDTTARPHLGNESTAKQDQCLRAWMERQTSRTQKMVNNED